MTVIVDTNIIISACLNAESELFKIITASPINLDFTTPDFTLREIILHQIEICKKSKKSISLFQDNLSTLLNHLFILSNEDLSDSNISKAESLTKDIDIDDTIFVAFSMALDLILWTGDLKLYKALRRKGYDKVIVTKELKQIIKGL